MNTTLLTRLVFSTLLSAALVTTAFARKIDIVAIAEHGKSAPALAAGAALPVASYVAFDAGYVEAGDPIAGEIPPSAETVSAALHRALSQAGYTRVAAAASPAVVLVYHWGVIRKDSIQIRPHYEIQPNHHTRLLLVTTPAELPRIEDWLVQRMDYPGSPARLFEIPSYRDAIDYARDPLYFVVVSAYDTAVLTRGEEQLLWRVKLSAPDNSGAMSQVIPTLLSVADRYFGRSLAERDRPKAAAVDAPPAAAPTVEESATPPTLPGVDPAFFAQLVKAEHAEFSGQRRSRPGAARTARP